uniref:Uncharacterized protein C630.12 n=1 Tax=Rhizophora mucronata TaxID=61149 RepID=A0A2P2LT40_RHIMU
MKQHDKLTLVFCGVWMVTLLYGEMFAYWVPSLWACSWPHHHHHRSRYSISSSETNGAMYPRDYKKVAVLTDPQLMDSTSLHLPSKSLALEIAQFYTDLYMRRAFFASILPFRPDVIVFLGDYFDGGPYLSDEEWQESLQRFRHIFGLNEAEGLADIQVYFIPGNHDVGYENVYFHKPEVIRRYEKEFGIRNYRFTVGKVEFIGVDAQTLDGHLFGNQSSMTWEFVKNVSNDIKLIPRVLLTHIPLFRRDNTYCGPLRKSPIVNQRIVHSTHDQDIMYQNYATEESSIKALELIRPILILSGHDHDQCMVVHGSKFGPVTEVGIECFGHV